MATINISITDKQNKFIDQVTDSYGFDNRSEFFRNLIRLIQFKPELIHQASIFPFGEISTKSRSEIMDKLTKSGKYSKEFLIDMKEGLEDSKDFFTNK